MNGAEAPESPREALNGKPETTDSATGNAAAETGVNPDEKADSDEIAGSRRAGGTQRTIAEMKAEIDALKAKVEAAPHAQKSEPPAEDDDVLKVVNELRGDDDEYKRLHGELLDGGLSFADAERYRKMVVAREFEKEWRTVGTRQAETDFSKLRSNFYTGVATHYDAVKSKPGVDPDFVQNTADMGQLFDHIYEAGRSALAEENEQLRSEINELKKERLTRAPTLPRGGRSALGLQDRPDPREANPQDLLNAGIRQRSGGKR